MLYFNYILRAFWADWLYWMPMWVKSCLLGRGEPVVSRAQTNQAGDI